MRLIFAADNCTDAREGRSVASRHGAVVEKHRRQPRTDMVVYFPHVDDVCAIHPHEQLSDSTVCEGSAVSKCTPWAGACG